MGIVQVNQDRRMLVFEDAYTLWTERWLTQTEAAQLLGVCMRTFRRQVELFFKWIKQNLRIKKFLGTSENPVKTQVWVAVSAYVLVAIVKRRLDLDAPLHTLLQILSVTLFEKMPLNQCLLERDHTSGQDMDPNQLSLFEYEPDTSASRWYLVSWP